MADSQIDISEEEIDRAMLESYGVTDGTVFYGVLNESLVRKPRLFGVDGFLVFNLDDSVDYLLKDDALCAVLDEFAGKSYDEGSCAIACEWSPEFTKGLVRDWLMDLTKGEVLVYDEALRRVADDFGEDGLARSVKCDDRRFGIMPKIVRIQ